jgi:hypothetical protein
MKLLKSGLRFWLTLASVTSFAGGWAMLAHAPKPYQLFQQTTAPTLEPLPPLFDAQAVSDQQQLFNIQPRRRSNGFFRTGGS